MAKNENIKELGVLTEKQLEEFEERRKNQGKYWQDRAERVYQAGEKDALQVAKELKASYERSVKEIEKEINAFYGKWALKEGVSYAEAQKLLNRKELKEFKSYIEEMLKMGEKANFTSEELRKFKILYGKARISRLDELQANIRFELDKLASMTEEQIHDMLYRSYENSYYQTVFNVQQFNGFASSFSGLNTAVIEKAIATKYLKENYSQRIWKNTDKLMSILEQEIPRGLEQGFNPKKLASEIVSKRIDQTAYNNTVRLIRTEYNKVLNDATLEGYRAAGIEQYEICSALEQTERTCKNCQHLDYRTSHKAYYLNEAAVGITFPPFHSNCRCTTIAHFEEDEIDKMSTDELSKIGFITYDDWKNGLVRLENDKVIYKGGE